jgi:cellulose synthase/poly-beta-1,6-N-acetylglucosamine synthase-like glycosyltransferase
MLGGTQEQPGADPPAAGPDRLLEEVPRTSDRGLVDAVVPAHNQQERIGTAIGSLAEQSSPQSSILVCADNCTDGSALAARSAGASELEAVGNEHGRAGALNQGLELLLPVLRDDDAVLIATAVFVLADSFLAESRRRLERGVGGVGDHGQSGPELTLAAVHLGDRIISSE